MAGNTILLNVQTNVDDATKDLNKIDDGVDKVKKSTKELSEESKKTTMNWTELSSKINVFKEAFGAVKDTVTKIYEVSKQLVQEFEKVNNQMTILKSQKVWGEIKLQFDELEKATGGVIDKFDILESVNKATSFGIDLTQGRLLKLVDVSSKAAAMMGTDLKSAFDSLIVGTARESKAILDNLGVMVDVTGVQEQYAKSINKTVEELTDEEQKISVLNAVLDNLGKTQASISNDTLLSAGSGQIAFFERVWRNFKLSAGEALSDISNYFNELMQNDVTNAMKHLNIATKEEAILRNEAVAVYVKTLEDIAGPIDLKLRNNLIEQIDREKTHATLIEEIGKQKESQAEALKIVTEQQNGLLEDSGTLTEKEANRKELLNELEEKYGEKVRANFELQIAKGEAAFELAKKRGEISQDAEFDLYEFLRKQNNEMTNILTSSVAWLAAVTDTKDAFEKMFDMQQEDTVSARGSQTVDDATIKNMKANDEKTAKLSKDLSNKRAQAKIDKEEKDRQELLKRQEKAMMDVYGVIQKEMTEQSKIREQMAIDSGKAMTDLSDMQSKDSIERLKTDNEIELDLILQQQDYKQKILDDYIEYELKKEKEKNKEREKIQDMGNAVFTAAANSVYNDLISGQEDFLQRAAAVALSTAGSQIFADGLKNVWIGGGQLLATGGLKGGETLAYGVAEMGVGIALGYAGNQVMPDTATKEGDSASEKNKMDSGNYTFNITSSLYGTKKEAQRGLSEVMR